MNKRKATVYTVAEHAGVSIATVSRTLAGSRKVSPATRQRVMRAIEDLNFEPNPSARRLAYMKSETIALVFPDISGPFYSTVIRGVEQEAGRHNHNVLIYGTHGKEGSGRYLRTLTSKVDGLIIMARSVDEDSLWSLERHGVPFVLLGQSNGQIQCSMITVDNEAGAYRAATHLLGHGHQRIGIITGPEDSPDNKGRLQGYRKALLEAGTSLQPNMIVPGNFRYREGRIAIQQLLNATSPPTAVLAANDEMAIGALDAALERGLRVPEDLAVIGFDDIQMAALTRPSLSTIRQPMQLLGEAAVRLLFERLQNPDAPSHHELLETQLVIRQSCGCSVPSNAATSKNLG
jgi:LacI family transcriptional regulator, galactose operon repressor